MASNNNTDADIAYVVRHPRFRGVAPSGVPGEYVIRIDDGTGHEIEIAGPLVQVFRTAAGALRRIP